jgi:hypothetical protein
MRQRVNIVLQIDAVLSIETVQCKLTNELVELSVPVFAATTVKLND